jgi:hypothetical protein
MAYVGRPICISCLVGQHAQDGVVPLAQLLLFSVPVCLGRARYLPELFFGYYYFPLSMFFSATAFGDFHNQVNKDICHHRNTQQLYSSTSNTHFSYQLFSVMGFSTWHLPPGGGGADLCLLSSEGYGREPPAPG